MTGGEGLVAPAGAREPVAEETPTGDGSAPPADLRAWHCVCGVSGFGEGYAKDHALEPHGEDGYDITFYLRAEPLAGMALELDRDTEIITDALGCENDEGYGCECCSWRTGAYEALDRITAIARTACATTGSRPQTAATQKDVSA